MLDTATYTPMTDAIETASRDEICALQLHRFKTTLARAYANVAHYTPAFDKAGVDLTEAIRLNPELAEAQNSLAWHLATCPHAEFRDGRQAVRHATKACELTQWKGYTQLDSLAAACAEAGDFENAVKWQQKAVDMADEKWKEDFRSRLDLYKAGKPYHEDQQE